MTIEPGWLVEQLPRVMAEDQFLQRFVRIFEDVAGTVRARVDDVDGFFDVRLGPPEFVRWMASWVGLSIDPSMPEDRQRSLAMAIGPLFPYRGTTRGIEAMLEALTQSDVAVDDTGGVYPEGNAPSGPRHVEVRVGDPGELDPQQLLRIVQGEVPADTTVDLVVGTSTIETEEESDELIDMVDEAIVVEPAPEVQPEEVPAAPEPEVEAPVEDDEDEPAP
jgi:phage tail-like protein